MGDKKYVLRMINSYLNTLNKKAVFIKQYDLQGVELEQIVGETEVPGSVKLFFYEYNIYKMKSAYEPFLLCIRQAYYSEYADNYSVEEFVEKCGVYSLQREVFSSYIRTGVCERKFDVLMSEYEYEDESFRKSLYSALKYISGDRMLVFVIGRLHMALLCVLEFINSIFSRNDSIRFVFTYGESFLVKEYCNNEWHSLIEKAEEDKMFLIADTNEVIQSPEFPDIFEYNESDIDEYITQLNNMVHFFAFKDALYYFDSIMTSIYRVDSTVSNDRKFRLLELLGMVYLGMGNYKDALLTCEKMVPFFNTDKEQYREYIYNYFSGKAHLIMEDTALTHKFCDRCRKYAIQMNDEFMLSNTDVIDNMAELGSMKEMFRCNFSHKISREVEERAIRTGNRNFLAYIYIFGYDNDLETVQKIGDGEIEPVYFNKGIEIAKELGNNNLMLNAYMKNIILFSARGSYKYVDEMYQKRLEILDRDKPVRIAHTYCGLGYNAIIMEDYAKADEYFKKSLDMLIGFKRAEDIAEILYNMFMNYYVSGVNEKVVECIELLLKIMKIIHIQSIRICNTSKMYGILTLAYYKMGQFLDCYYCLDMMETILSYVLNKNDENEEEMWLEDLFLYHLCKANIMVYENKFEEAQEQFNCARKYMIRNEGIKFYSYIEYAMFYSDFLIRTGRSEESKKTLEEVRNFCVEQNYPVKASVIDAKLNDVSYDYKITYTTPKLPVNTIMDVCNFEGTRIELEKRRKDIDFLTLCHNIVGKNECNINDVVKQTMNLICNSFSIDRILLIENASDSCEFTYKSETVNVNQAEAQELIEFFKAYKIEFMSSRLEKSFHRYSKVIEKMGGDDIAVIVGIPVFCRDELTRVFIATIDVHRSFTENRRLPDYNDLEVIKCAVHQLDEEIGRIKSNGMIRIMNEQLEKAAFTDQLTGIYNRMGFNKILDGKIADTGVLLYMDLDDFKKYNDTYGHGVGDIILKVFAGIISDNIDSIGYAIRYGGDEFVAVLPNKDESFAENIAFNIQYQLREEAPDKIRIEGLSLTSSVGIAMYENADRDGLEMALKWADKALYHVKNSEKGTVAIWSRIRDIL